jgi:hypothetical protein
MVYLSKGVHSISVYGSSGKMYDMINVIYYVKFSDFDRFRAKKIYLVKQLNI